MNVETIELSTCCDAEVVGEIYEGYNEHDHWGICADCSEWTVFATDLTDWPTSDVDESIEELQTPFTGIQNDYVILGQTVTYQLQSWITSNLKSFRG